MRRRWMTETGVSAISALAVVGVYLWIEHQTTHKAAVARPDPLDRTIDVSLDFSSVSAALQSLEAASGLKFEYEGDLDYPDQPASRLPLKNVSVRTALRLIFEHHNALNDVDCCVDGGVVRLRHPHQSDPGTSIVRTYDLRRLIESDRRFTESVDGAPAVDPPANPAACFSQPGRRRGILDYPSSSAGMAIMQLSKSWAEHQWESGGWLTVRTTVDHHLRIQTAIERLEALR